MSEEIKKDCKRCLLYEMSKEAFENIYEYIRLIPPEIKADNAVYENRLEICRDCGCLINGMCVKCGCYVEVRAAVAKNRCPHEKRRW